MPSSPPQPQPYPHLHDPVAVPRDQGCDNWIQLPICWYLLASLAPLDFAVHLEGRLEVPITSPYFHLKGCLGTHKLDVPSPHIKNIWSPCGYMPCHCLDFYLDAWHYIDCHYHVFHFPTVKDYWLQFSVGSVLPLTAVQFAHSTSQNHPSPHSLWLRCPPPVSPLAVTQPCGLLSWVGICYPCIIIQVVHGMAHLLMNPMKKVIP